jgi:predicted RNase H-like nuclease (RuvC/YqgF family)
MKRRQTDNGSLDQLLAQTQEMVARLVREHRSLKAQNARLAKEVERLSRGWDDIRRVARSVPRRRRPASRSSR